VRFETGGSRISDAPSRLRPSDGHPRDDRVDAPSLFGCANASHVRSPAISGPGGARPPIRADRLHGIKEKTAPTSPLLSSTLSMTKGASSRTLPQQIKRRLRARWGDLVE